MRSSFDVSKYLKRTDRELYAIHISTRAFLCALGRPNYLEATKAFRAQLRIELHNGPRAGHYVRGNASRRSLDDIPDLPSVGSMAVDFKRATARRIHI